MLASAPAAAQQRPETPPERQAPRTDRERLQIKAGVQYEQGDYGTGDDSRAVYAPFTFKYLGRRVFLMTPIHHHFELAGWTETQTVIRFWVVAAFAALFGLTVVF